VNDEVTKPWLQFETRYSPAQLVSSIGCDDFVEFVTKPALGYMSECNEKYDLIFLDGHHAAKSVYQEIPAALRLLKPGGLILLHDFFPGLKPLWSNGAIESGPVLATDRIRSEGVAVKVLPFGELPWPTKLGSNITSLALLVRENSPIDTDATV
jgi:predicted O-methyltransferase YrrM